MSVVKTVNYIDGYVQVRSGLMINGNIVSIDIRDQVCVTIILSVESFEKHLDQFEDMIATYAYDSESDILEKLYFGILDVFKGEPIIPSHYMKAKNGDDLISEGFEEYELIVFDEEAAARAERITTLIKIFRCSNRIDTTFEEFKELFKESDPEELLTALSHWLIERREGYAKFRKDLGK